MMQLPKPKGDTRKWLPRALETDKYIQNHKDMLIYWVHKTEQEYETAASAYEIWEIDGNELTRANLNVIKQYNKLYQMDHFHIIQIDGKDYNDDYYHHMAPSQIIRSSEYNAAASSSRFMGEATMALRRRGKAPVAAPAASAPAAPKAQNVGGGYHAARAKAPATAPTTTPAAGPDDTAAVHAAARDAFAPPRIQVHVRLHQPSCRRHHHHLIGASDGVIHSSISLWAVGL